MIYSFICNQEIFSFCIHRCDALLLNSQVQFVIQHSYYMLQFVTLRTPCFKAFSSIIREFLKFLLEFLHSFSYGIQ
jgi:hypothetical protein